MPTALVEICVQSLAEARAALAVPGVERVEFCAALDVGGLTPALRDVAELCAAAPRRVAVMLRPRGGNFVYDRQERAEICRQAGALRSAGAAVLVVGALRADREIDVDVLRAVQRAAPGEFVFHRAFDELADCARAVEQLCELGVGGILTSGAAPTALAGAATLARLVALGGVRTRIIAAGGIRSSNVASLVQQSGAREVHSAARARADGRYQGLDLREVQALTAAVK